MAFVNTGTQRTLNLTVKKTGNDSSVVDPYLTLDGKLAFGTYAQITTDEMQKLSDVDFAARVTAWKIYLQSTYAISDPDMWNDIESSFKYVNGVIVRLYDIGNGTLKTTVKGYVNGGSTFSTKVVDSYGNLIHQFDIYPGTTESSGVSWDPGVTTLQEIIDGGRFQFLDNSTSYNHPTIHLEAVVDINQIYPLPV